MIKQLLFILLLLTQLNAASRDFSLIIHKPFDAALLSVTEDYDRTITAVGFSKNYQQHAKQPKSFTDPYAYLASVSDKYGYRMHLVKVTNQAKIVLSKTVNIPDFTIAVSVEKTPTNGYFLGGYTMDGSLLLVKLDASAHLIYYKKFGTKNFDKMNSLIALRDGGVLAVGSSVTSRNIHDNIFETGLGNDDIFITRFSKNGKLLWSKKYGTSHDDHGISAAEANDGSLLIVATTQYDKNKDVTLMRLGENGDKIWLKHFHSKQLIEPKKIIRLKNGNFLLALAVYDSFSKEQVRLISFDLYKNIIHDETYMTQYSSELDDIAEFSNGKIMGVGLVKDRFNTDALVMIFDTQLQLLKQEHYGGKNYDMFHAMHILYNSQVAAVGVHTDNNSQEENMWIVKLNADGTLAQINLSNHDLYTELCRVFAKEIANHDIVIHQDLTIDITNKSLYFRVGKYKLTQQQKAFLQHFSKKLIAFIKKHQNKIATLAVNGHTSSEWAKSNFEQGYLNNMQLSQQRAYATLRYIFTIQSPQTQHYLTKILEADGLSYKKKIILNAVEDKKKSRRVSFKILLR